MLAARRGSAMGRSKGRDEDPRGSDGSVTAVTKPHEARHGESDRDSCRQGHGAARAPTWSIALPSRGLDMFASLSTGLSALVKHSDWEAVAVLPVGPSSSHMSETDSQRFPDTPAMAAIPSFNGKHDHPVWIKRTVVESIVDGTLTGPTPREVLRWANAVDVPAEPGPSPPARINPTARGRAARSRRGEISLYPVRQHDGDSKLTALPKLMHQSPASKEQTS